MVEGQTIKEVNQKTEMVEGQTIKEVIRRRKW